MFLARELLLVSLSSGAFLFLAFTERGLADWTAFFSGDFAVVLACGGFLLGVSFLDRYFGHPKQHKHRL